MKKIMKNTFNWLLALSIFLLIATANSYAQSDNPQAPMQGKFNRGKDFINTLNLSPEQQAQIKQQGAMNMKRRVELRQKLHAKRLELKQELDRPQVDMNKVKVIVSETKALMAEQLDLRVKDILAMKQVLTPEQFRKLQEERSKNQATIPKPHE